MAAAFLVAGFVCVALADTPTAETTAAPTKRVSETDLAAYKVAEANAGRGAEAQVKLALWCESHGMTPERLKHLARAVLSDPTNATARGLMGLVSYSGRWTRPETVADKVKSDQVLATKLAEYNARRAKADQTADAQWKLALWCEENGLKGEATAHFSEVVRLDPSRAAAWKKLGCKFVSGRWISTEQLATETAHAEAQRLADKKWKPLLAKWASQLGERNPARRGQAEAALAEVDDPRAVPSVWAVFVKGGPDHQAKAVEILGQIDAPNSSHGLALIAALSPHPQVRRVAVEILRRRDPREFLDVFVSSLQDPIKYEVRPVGGPGIPGGLYVQGKRVNVQRVYAPPAMPNFSNLVLGTVKYDTDGLPVVTLDLGTTTSVNNSSQQFSGAQYNGLAPVDPSLVPVIQAARANPNSRSAPTYDFRAANVIDLKQGQRMGVSPNYKGRLEGTNRVNVVVSEATTTVKNSTVDVPVGRIMLEYQKSAEASQQQLQNDVEALESENLVIRESNGRIATTLAEVTGQSLGEDRETWTRWWTDQQGYAYNPPPVGPVPTVFENVAPEYLPNVPSYSPRTTGQSSTSAPQVSTVTFGHSCFAAGTSVRTLDGFREIESVRVGDQLLTQDVHKGELSYQPVLAIYHNKPSSTLRIKLSQGESVVATPIHRFWRAGDGWTMARDLKVGDTLRTLGGTAQVAAIDDDKAQPVFNLHVAKGQSFFVGDTGILVHDNSVVSPERAPFDAK